MSNLPSGNYPLEGALTLEELERRVFQNAQQHPANVGGQSLPSLPPLSGSLWSFQSQEGWNAGRQQPQGQSMPPANFGNHTAPHPGTTDPVTGVTRALSGLMTSQRAEPSYNAIPSGSRLLAYTSSAQGPAQSSVRSQPSAPKEVQVLQPPKNGDKRVNQETSKPENRARFEWEPVGVMDVRPNIAGPDEYLDVVWEIPASFVSQETLSSSMAQQKKSHGNVQRDDQQGDWIGLFRSRQRIDDMSNHILTRETAGRTVFDSRTGMVRGKVRLRAPRGVGTYDFRYFSGSSSLPIDADQEFDPRRFPLARSPSLTVAVQGFATIEALQFVDKNLKDRKRFSAAAQQLATLVRQLSTLRSPLQTNSTRPEDQERRILEEIWKVLSYCVEKGIQLDESMNAQIELQRVKAAEAHAEYVEASKSMGQGRDHDEAELALEDEGDYADLDLRVEEDQAIESMGVSKGDGTTVDPATANRKEKQQTWVMIRRDLAQVERDRATVASSVKGVIDDVRTNRYLYSLLTDSRKRHLSSVVRRYSCLEEHFFVSDEELRNHTHKEFGIAAWGVLEDGRIEVDVHRAPEIESAVDRIIHGLVPGPEFYEQRRVVIRKLQSIIDKDIAPSAGSCRLVPFGSSANSFGNPNSDLDLCLVFQNHALLSGQEAAQTVSTLAHVLTQYGYTQVDDSRKTARIPIVQFRDPEFDVECDICVNNPLAVRNTLLLRTYGSIDERATRLVYLVKAWAKKRDLNNPSAHTLSSYGWILLCVNYLQRIGLLPVLQEMPVPMPSGPGGQDQRFFPKVMVSGADGKLHDTYFFGDPESQFFATPEARERAAQEARRGAFNFRAGLADILCGFFWDLAMNDWRRYVSSVRFGGLVLKANKAAEDSWRLHPRCAIEDPFETSYDVGHVLRDSTFRRIRCEAARAYALLVGCYEGMGDRPAAECLDELLRETQAEVNDDIDH